MFLEGGEPYYFLVIFSMSIRRRYLSLVSCSDANRRAETAIAV
jgi:hypothetical protein